MKENWVYVKVDIILFYDTRESGAEEIHNFIFSTSLFFFSYMFCLVNISLIEDWVGCLEFYKVRF